MSFQKNTCVLLFWVELQRIWRHVLFVIIVAIILSSCTCCHIAACEQTEVYGINNLVNFLSSFPKCDTYCQRHTEISVFTTRILRRVLGVKEFVEIQIVVTASDTLRGKSYNFLTPENLQKLVKCTTLAALSSRQEKVISVDFLSLFGYIRLLDTLHRQNSPVRQDLQHLSF